MREREDAGRPRFLTSELPSVLARQLFYKKAADGQHVHFCSQETVDALFGCADDRLVFIERGVEQHRNTGKLFELLDQFPVKGILVAADGLKPARPVHVCRRRNYRSLLRLDLVSHEHERRRMRLLEIISNSLKLNRRSKGS